MSFLCCLCLLYLGLTWGFRGSSLPCLQSLLSPSKLERWRVSFGWFLLIKSPWKPSCCASYMDGAPTNLSWHQFPSSSNGDEFNEWIQTIIIVNYWYFSGSFELIKIIMMKIKDQSFLEFKGFSRLCEFWQHGDLPSLNFYEVPCTQFCEKSCESQWLLETVLHAIAYYSCLSNSWWQRMKSTNIKYFKPK